MTERAAHGTNDGVRRFLEDLRSGFDRRTGLQRRRHRLIGDVDWNAADRRVPPRDRRAGPYERRRPPAGAFEFTHRGRLAAILADASLAADCPQCGGHLLLSEVTRAGRGVPVIHCTGCRRRTEMA